MNECQRSKLKLLTTLGSGVLLRTDKSVNGFLTGKLDFSLNNTVFGDVEFAMDALVNKENSDIAKGVGF